MDEEKVLKSDQIFRAFLGGQSNVSVIQKFHTSSTTAAYYRAAYDCITTVESDPQKSIENAKKYAKLTRNMGALKAAADFVYTEIPQNIIDTVNEVWGIGIPVNKQNSVPAKDLSAISDAVKSLETAVIKQNGIVQALQDSFLKKEGVKNSIVESLEKLNLSISKLPDKITSTVTAALTASVNQLQSKIAMSLKTEFEKLPAQKTDSSEFVKLNSRLTAIENDMGRMETILNETKKSIDMLRQATGKSVDEIINEIHTVSTDIEIIDDKVNDGLKKLDQQETVPVTPVQESETVEAEESYKEPVEIVEEAPAEIVEEEPEKTAEEIEKQITKCSDGIIKILHLNNGNTTESLIRRKLTLLGVDQDYYKEALDRLVEKKTIVISTSGNGASKLTRVRLNGKR